MSEADNHSESFEIFSGNQDISRIDPVEPNEVTSTYRTRSNLAYIFAGSFVFIIVMAMIAPLIAGLFACIDKQLTLEIIKTIIPPTVAVVGTITGFYFGSNKK